MAKLESLLHDLRVSVVGTDDDPRVGALSRPARFLSRPVVRTLYRASVRGIHHVPLTGPVIMSPNHLSFFDTPLVMSMSPRPVIFLGKAEYMNSRATKFLFPAIGMVPIKRDVAKASMAALITAGELLNDGQVVGIYPEGTRSRDGLLHRGHSGVAQLALMTGAPIVPVGIVGTERVQPIGQNVPKPFQGNVQISFGEPIYPQRYQYGGSRKRRQQITDDVMASIASMTAQPRSADFASDREPLIRGGSESVYLVTSHKATGLSWRHAAERAVDDGRPHLRRCPRRRSSCPLMSNRNRWRAGVRSRTVAVHPAARRATAAATEHSRGRRHPVTIHSNSDVCHNERNTVMNERNTAMNDSVYRVIELIGSSHDSWEQAARNAVKEASAAYDDLRVAEVVEMDVLIEDGSIIAFRTKLRLTYKASSD